MNLNLTGTRDKMNKSEKDSENILGVLILKLWERVIRMEVNFENPSLPQYPEIY